MDVKGKGQNRGMIYIGFYGKVSIVWMIDTWWWRSKGSRTSSLWSSSLRNYGCRGCNKLLVMVTDIPSNDLDLDEGIDSLSGGEL